MKPEKHMLRCSRCKGKGVHALEGIDTQGKELPCSYCLGTGKIMKKGHR